MIRKHTLERGLVPAVIAVCLALAGCATIYYSVWEKLGWEKRDLLRDDIEAVQKEQKEVGEQFTSALEKIRAIYGMKDGSLEKQYDALRVEYDGAKSRASRLRARIDAVEEVAGDLFTEWERELGEISDTGLRTKSRRQLEQTKRRYALLAKAMHRSEQSVEPVLSKLKDHVLFLKHNLNAQAIGSLEGEVTSIEEDVSQLIADLQTSIEKSDEFIKQLPN